MRSYLATGHARTTNARARTRNGWIEITTVLNSVGNGCTKDWKRWAKYWKDKKAAIKRKANIAKTAMKRRSGGINQEIMELSDLEKKILTISRGLSLASGDRNLAINPLPEQRNAVQPPLSSESSSHSESNLQKLHGENAAAVVEDKVAENLHISTIATPSEQSECVWIQDGIEMVFPSDRDRNRKVEGEMPTIGSSDGDGGARRRIWCESPSRHRGSSVSSPTQRPGANSQRRRTALTSPREGVPAGRRRPLHWSPPSQRRSEMERLIERLIAIEEQRAGAELASSRSREELIRSREELTRSREALARSREALARSREALARTREAEAQGNSIIARAIDRFGDTIRDTIRQSLETILHFKAPNT